MNDALQTLVELRRGAALPLPPRLARLFGRLRLPLPRGRPQVYSNFVSTLDGVVSLNVKGHESGADISGHDAQDRMVMGLLRAVADAVVIGAGTLAADRRHVWTAAAIHPPLARDYARLGAAIGQRGLPLNVVVSGSGDLDLRLPVFSSGRVRALILTSTAGERRLRRQRVPDATEIRAVAGRRTTIDPAVIVAEVGRTVRARRILVEGGPRLLGDFQAARLLDEQFLTLAPQVAGRDADDRRIGLVMGHRFAPDDPRWGALIEVRRGRRLLFLRYAFPHAPVRRSPA